jgi:hypothetical protein
MEKYRQRRLVAEGDEAGKVIANLNLNSKRYRSENR